VLMGLYIPWVAQLCWASNLQEIVALSTTEVEYVAVVEA
jgi:hypothetical protein